jgi:prepilin-type N-terminal cleavage/methylation domain-containing protein
MRSGQSLLRFLRNRLPRGQQGFSLIELMVAAAAGTVLLAAVMAVYVSSLYAFANERQRMVNNDVTRVAIDQLSRYIRAISYPASTQRIADAIEVSLPNDFVFYTDLEGNGSSDKVEYYITNTGNPGRESLKMKTAAPVMSTTPPSYGAYSTDGLVVLTAIRNSTGPIFTYYRFNTTSNQLEAFTPTTAIDRSTIVAVGIRVVVNEVPKIARGDVELQTAVQIRQRYNGGLTGG